MPSTPPGFWTKPSTVPNLSPAAGIDQARWGRRGTRVAAMDRGHDMPAVGVVDLGDLDHGRVAPPDQGGDRDGEPGRGQWREAAGAAQVPDVRPCLFRVVGRVEGERAEDDP